MVDLKKRSGIQQRQATPRPKPVVDKRPRFSVFYKQGLFLFIVTLLVNFNTLTLGYALDDTLMITQNKITQKGISGIPEIWSHDLFLGYFGKSGVEAGGRFRPMSQTIFALQVQFFGSKPAVGHFFNVLFYTITCLMLFFLLSKIFPPDEKKSFIYSLPFVSALLYALHPLHVEAVANIKSLDEVLAMFFSLATTLWIIKYYDRKRILNLVLGGLAFFLALTSKENALTFLAVIPLSLFYLKKDTKQILIGTIPLLVVAVIYYLIRSAALGPVQQIAPVDNFLTNPFFGASFMEKMATILMSWLKYMQLMVFPYPLTTDYYPAMIPVTNWMNLWVSLSFLFYSGLGIFALWKLPKRNQAAFGILFFFITFSVVSNLFVNLGTPVNDRFVFMPLAGFCLAFAYLLTVVLPSKIKPASQKNVVMIVLVVFGLGFAMQTFSRNLDWKDDFTLFKHDITVSENSARCNVMTGKTYYEEAGNLKDSLQKKEFLDKAVVYLNQGLKIYQGYYLAWGLLGVIEMDKQNYRTSLDYFVKCLEIEPTQSVALANLSFIGRKMLEKNDREGCVQSFRQLRHFAPKNPDSYLVMAEVFYKHNKADSAIILVDQLLKIDAKNAVAWRMKGEINANFFHDELTAEACFLKSFEIDPNDVAVLDNLGVNAFHKKDFSKSLLYFNKAVSLDPANPHFLQNVASTYSAMGNAEKMNEYLQRAQQAQAMKK
ncbi:MAG: hypothetical protein WCO63_13705 [Bacteroidota bacterium]